MCYNTVLIMKVFTSYRQCLNMTTIIGCAYLKGTAHWVVLFSFQPVFQRFEYNLSTKQH